MNSERRSPAARQGVRLGLPTVGGLLAIVGAGAFALGQSLSTEAPPAAMASVPAEPGAAEEDMNETVESLPPGHPPIDSVAQGGALTPEMPPEVGTRAGQETTSLAWRAPPRWEQVPNTSAMRLATYRVPRAAGDPVDAELSITRAGGSVDANVERWIGQFDPAGQKTAKRSTRRVGPLEVHMVEVQGTYSGGMGKNAPSGSGWALLGAIVSTPDMPYFFKLVGPAKSVMAAHAELDDMVAGFTSR